MKEIFYVKEMMVVITNFDIRIYLWRRIVEPLEKKEVRQSFGCKIILFYFLLRYKTE